jgi:ABC-type branched-subunit amino acid transport system substrate-binding protein
VRNLTQDQRPSRPWFALWPGLAIALCAPAVGADHSVPIRIGLLLPPEEAEATSLRQGAELAVAWANRSAAVPVELVVRGRPGQWGDDGVEAGRLVLDDFVIGLVAPPGGMPTHLALQVAGRTATPVVSLCPDHSVTGAGVPWSVRIVPSTIDEASTVFAHFSATHPRWAALVPEERTGREITRDLTEAASTTRCHLEPVTVVGECLADPSILASRLPKPWPDGFLIWLDTKPAALVIRHLRDAGYRGILAGPGRLFSAEFQELAGSALDDFIVARPKPVPAFNSLATRFETDYRKIYDLAPDPTSAMACDAVSLLLRLHAQSDSGAIHRQFPIRETSMGVTGTLEFDRQGNRLLPLELSQFQSGQWRSPQPPSEVVVESCR